MRNEPTNLFWFCPDHDTGQPIEGDGRFFSFLPDVSPISSGTEQCFQLCWILITVSKMPVFLCLSTNINNCKIIWQEGKLWFYINAAAVEVVPYIGGSSEKKIQISPHNSGWNNININNQNIKTLKYTHILSQTVTSFPLSAQKLPHWLASYLAFLCAWLLKHQFPLC